jgi:natural product biosynthesis luciferase-like monooxygenase protein
MKISLLYLPTYRSQRTTFQQLYRDILEEVEFADRNGFDAVWFAEHHFFPYGGAIPSVPVLATAAAERTRRIRLGSGVGLIGLNDPIRVAEEFAMLDNLSGGRLDFGIGRAFQRAEYDAFNVPMDESRARFNDAHEIIMKAWTQDAVSHDSKYRTLRDVTVIPRPLQKPHPPVYVACIMTEESFRFTGERGYNLMYVPYVGTPELMRERLGWYGESLLKGGHDPKTHDVMVAVHFFCGESAAHARDYPREFISDYLDSAAEANQTDADAVQYRGYSGLAKNLERLSKNYELMYPNQVVFGDAEQCLKRIEDYEALGATHVSLVTNFGGMPHTEIMRSLERFAKDVIPRIKRKPDQQSAAAGR